jgi:hypothetical protein
MQIDYLKITSVTIGRSIISEAMIKFAFFGGV